MVKDSFAALVVALLVSKAAVAEEFQYLGNPTQGIPASSAVKVGKLVFASGTPASSKDGKIAVGDFPAQMTQVMENIASSLKSVGAGWDRVAKMNVMLTRSDDFGEMNRIYKAYFHDGKYPVRSTVVVILPDPDFLLEIECEAVVE